MPSVSNSVIPVPTAHRYTPPLKARRYRPSGRISGSFADAPRLPRPQQAGRSRVKSAAAPEVSSSTTDGLRPQPIGRLGAIASDAAALQTNGHRVCFIAGRRHRLRCRRACRYAAAATRFFLICWAAATHKSSDDPWTRLQATPAFLPDAARPGDAPLSRGAVNQEPPWGGGRGGLKGVGKKARSAAEAGRDIGAAVSFHEKRD